MMILITGEVVAVELRPAKTLCSPVTVEQCRRNGVSVQIERLADRITVYDFENQQATMNATGSQRLERTESSSGRIYIAKFLDDVAVRVSFNPDFSSC